MASNGTLHLRYRRPRLFAYWRQVVACGWLLFALLFQRAIASPQATDAATVAAGEGVTPPVLISKFEPDYSEAARKLEVQGKVVLRAVIPPDGTPTDFKILSSLGFGLDEKAIDTIRRWRFKPGMKDGKAVATAAIVEVNFPLGLNHDSAAWISGPMAFAINPNITPPVVEDGAMPKPGDDISDESVVLEFVVDTKGSVKSFRRVYGSEAAAESLGRSLSAWKFRAAVDGGNFVEATGRVRFIRGKGDEAVNRPLFDIQSTPAPPAPAFANLRTIVNQKDGQNYVWIPPGTFTMGCSEGDTECYGDETPHSEKIPKGFWLGRTEVTQAAYQRVTGTNPSAHKGDQFPVEQVTWEDASKYCAAIGGRLPSEVEWEYSARAGSTFARYGNLDEVAWYAGNSGGATHPVGMKAANGFGLVDMLGNVWEWVEENYPGSQAKVERGGNALDSSRDQRASRRGSNLPIRSFYGVGFRCAGEFAEPPVEAVTSVSAPPSQAVPPQPAAAQSVQRTPGQEILDKVGQVYSRLTSIRVSGKTEESHDDLRQQHGIIEASFEVAAQGNDHHFLRLKVAHEEEISASDGENTWKALRSRKQWSQVEAATVAETALEIGERSRNELYLSMAARLFGEFPRMARAARAVEVVREADYKLAYGHVPCYVLEVQRDKVEEELWVDKARFLVLERVEKLRTQTSLHTASFKVDTIEVNQAMPQAEFQFRPEKGWTEVESLQLPGEQVQTLAGSHAARFALKTLEGERTDLAAARGKVVVLDFWATWCPPCRKELPVMEKLRNEFADNVVMYGINDEEAGTVKDFVRKNQYQMTVLMDGSRQVHRLYGISAIPTLLIIDRQGVIRKLYVGSRDEATLRKAIQSVVSE
jgi:TonB family protein